MPTAAHVARFVVCSGILISTSAATWINPPPRPETSTAEQPRGQVSLQPRGEIPSNPGSAAAAEAGIEVSQWEFSPAISGRPLYLSMTLDGTQTAVDRIKTGPLMIQVHWVREGADSAPGAPDLVTDLAIGRQDLAGTLADEVRRKGSFEWHSWARKDTLSPGTWTVSLTYPNGQPLSCGQGAEPCRFTINVG